MIDDGFPEEINCKDDLHGYMRLRRRWAWFFVGLTWLFIMGIYLPRKDLTKLEFLQDIITDEKKFLYSHEVENRTVIASWPEYALSNVWA